MADRKKILMLCDHPLVPSGVGTQARYLIEGLLKTQKYKFVVYGGAMKHPDYRPQQIAPEVYGEGNWIVYPVDGYGDKDRLRHTLMAEKPDVMIMFTDPRFFTWVWEMEDEVRQVCPIMYWHVWDNDPTPVYNKVFYDSTDFISCLSLKTYGLLQDMKLSPDKFNYIPHAVSPDVFKPVPEDECAKFKREKFGPHGETKFIVFWNNRNARRKMTGDVIASFAKFANKVGKNNVALAMHTSVGDPEGQNIVQVARCFDVEKNLIISEERVPPEVLNMFYNTTDCTINIANNEGFGLATLESLMAGSPIIVNMTGGLQFQIGDWWDKLTDFSNQDKLTDHAKKALRSGTPNVRWFGVPLFPATRSCTGSQPIPFIYDDRASLDDTVAALLKLYTMSRNERRRLGQIASAWAREKFNLSEMVSSWDAAIQEQLRKKATAVAGSSRIVDI